jgi:hypothetical protein
MGQRIDQFCENLRQKLTMTDSGLDGLKSKIQGKATHVEQDVQNHLDGVHKRIEQGRAKVSAAQADMKNWAEQRKAVTSDKIAEWKCTRRQRSMSRSRRWTRPSRPRWKLGWRARMPPTSLKPSRRLSSEPVRSAFAAQSYHRAT